MSSSVEEHHAPRGLSIRWSNVVVRARRSAQDLEHELSESDGPTDSASRAQKKAEQSPFFSILNSVSGSIPGGKLTAVMGPSGSGKTTLLDLLSGHLGRVNSISGTVSMTSGSIEARMNESTTIQGAGSSLPVVTSSAASNGKLQGYGSTGGRVDSGVGGWESITVWQPMFGYVLQDPLLLASATVEETLWTSARLRLPVSVDDSEIRSIVRRLTDDLGIAHRSRAQIGDSFRRGLSGGEKRRVSVGVELVTRPAVLFLDEPTTGLDSATAFRLVRLLRHLSRQYHCTVVATLHQPSSSIASLFDHFILMAHGRTAYCGPWRFCLPYFASIGHSCPKFSNPCDFLMDLITAEDSSTTTVEALAKRCPILTDPDVSDASCRTLLGIAGSSLELDVPLTPSEDDLEATSVDGKSTGTNSDSRSFGERRSPYSQPPPPPHSTALVPAFEESAAPLVSKSGSTERRLGFFGQVRVLSKRFIRDWQRNPLLFWSELIQYVFLSVFVGLMYLQVPSNVSAGEFDRVASLYYILVMLIFTPSFTIVTIFESERRLLQQEIDSRSYNVSSYFAAKTLVTWPIEIVFGIIFSVLVYYMIGFRSDSPSHVFYFIIVVLLTQLTSESLGFLCATASPRATIGVLILSVVMIVFMSFSGFMITKTPVYFKWISRVSFMNYAYDALCQNELVGLCLHDTMHRYTGEHGTCPPGSVPAESLMPPSIATGLSLVENIFVLLAYALFTRLATLAVLACSYDHRTRALLSRIYARMKRRSDSADELQDAIGV